MNHGENTLELMSDFFSHLDQPIPHSIEEEEHFTTLIDAVFYNIDQLAQLVFFDTEIDEENIQNYRKKLLNTLKKDFTTKLSQPTPSSFKDPYIADLEEVEESNSKFAKAMFNINQMIQS